MEDRRLQAYARCTTKDTLLSYSAFNSEGEVRTSWVRHLKKLLKSPVGGYRLQIQHCRHHDILQMQPVLKLVHAFETVLADSVPCHPSLTVSTACRNTQDPVRWEKLRRLDCAEQTMRI